MPTTPCPNTTSKFPVKRETREEEGPEAVVEGASEEEGGMREEGELGSFFRPLLGLLGTIWVCDNDSFLPFIRSSFISLLVFVVGWYVCLLVCV